MDSSITIRFYLAFLEQWEKLQTPRSTPRLPAQLVLQFTSLSFVLEGFAQISRAVRYVLEDDNACKFRGWAVMFDLPAYVHDTVMFSMGSHVLRRKLMNCS